VSVNDHVLANDRENVEVEVVEVVDADAFRIKILEYRYSVPLPCSQKKRI
jgi:hypothetical protein